MGYRQLERRLVTGLIDAAAEAEMLGVPKSWVLAEARADRIPHVRAVARRNAARPLDPR